MLLPLQQCNLRQGLGCLLLLAQLQAANVVPPTAAQGFLAHVCKALLGAKARKPCLCWTRSHEIYQGLDTVRAVLGLQAVQLLPASVIAQQLAAAMRLDLDAEEAALLQRGLSRVHFSAADVRLLMEAAFETQVS